MRKFVQSFHSHFPLFPRFCSDVSSSKPFKILSTGSFDALRRKDGYYLDKTHFIPKLEALGADAILSLRPRRFGKTLFLSTLSSYYDVKNRERFNQLFQDLYIGKNPTPLASKFLVLKLNFAGLRTNETYKIFQEDFFESLNRDLSKFMYRYKQELGNYFQVVDVKGNALANFKMLLDMVELSDNKAFCSSFIHSLYSKSTKLIFLYIFSFMSSSMNTMLV
jgi:hypothetical protein